MSKCPICDQPANKCTCKADAALWAKHKPSAPVEGLEWEYFTGEEALARGLAKLPTDEYWNDGTYIPQGWYPVTMLDVKGDPFPFANNGLRYRREVNPKTDAEGG